MGVIPQVKINPNTKFLLEVQRITKEAAIELENSQNRLTSASGSNMLMMLTMTDTLVTYTMSLEERIEKLERER